jgi:D-glycero-D-manno-heptose 1,7-bisphosphate phosphatase
MAKTKQKVVFIDRDGTLIEEVNYLSRVEDLRFFSFTVEAVRLLKENGFLVIVVTNQSGIGRGIYDEEAMHAIHSRIQADLIEKIDAFYFCPHLPDEGCACRKPGLGMIEAACRDFEIDLEGSWVVGDKVLDVQTGINAGLKTALVLTGHGNNERKKLTGDPHIVTEDLLAAAREILNS